MDKTSGGNWVRDQITLKADESHPLDFLADMSTS